MALRDLAGVRPEELEALLTEEVGVWRRELEWDFSASAGLVKRFVETGSLSGYAVEADGGVVGYAYYVAEEPKSLIGDLFLRGGYWTAENERALLGAVVGASMGARGVKRIEGQVALLRWAQEGDLPGARHAMRYPRYLMVADVERVREMRPRAVGERVVMDRWTERRQEEVAHLIAASYRGHIDSQINDQYRSAEGARRFLFNIVQYPGCGAFFPPGCWVALERMTGRVCGVSLASLVGEEVGHITQICVSPGMRGVGVGSELLRRSVEALGQSGARRVSLTVTKANEGAVKLYERVGFEVRKEFQALVWEGFGRFSG